MNKMKTNHEAMHMITDRAREYLAYMNATLKGASDDLYLFYPNGKKEWLGETRLANHCLELLNPYVVYEKGYENEPLEMFDSLDGLKEWCYLQKAAAIACGKTPLEYYYNYCYSVKEGGDFI